ncbi:MAG: aminotransferase class IV [Proteobacteria bacterium]|nr:aminotransferase class IV [Pseudomonadota bacterium]
MNKRLIWRNGQYIDANASIALLDISTHSLHYGGAIFEGIRSYDGFPFKLREHMQRLYKSADILNYDVPYKMLDLENIILDFSRKIGNAYIRPIIWLGDENYKIDGEGCSVNVAIIAFSFEEKNVQNPNLMISSWRKPSLNSFPYGCKVSSAYTLSYLAKSEAKNNGFQDALLLDQEGNIAESTTANVFMIQNKSILTPFTKYCLDGITRQTVLDIAKTIGVKSIVKDISILDLVLCDSVFLVGTVVEILPVRSINITKNDTLFFQLQEDSKILSSIINAYQKLTHPEQK